jgi:ATP-binding cassette subfamily B multidrug efflux pump
MIRMMGRRKRISAAGGRKDALGDADFSSSSHDLDDDQTRARFTQTLSQLARTLVAEWHYILPGLVFIGLGTVATVLGPRVLGWIIDRAVVPANHDLLFKLTLLYLGGEFVRAVSLILQAYCFDRLGQRVMQRLRIGLFSHLLLLPTSIYDRVPTGKLITRVTNDISALAEMFSAGFVTILGNFLTIAGILISLFILDWRLALVTGGIFPILALASVYFSRRLREAYRASRHKLSQLNAYLAENILGMKVVQLFNREAANYKRLEKINASYATAQTGTVKVFALFQPSITLAAGLSAALVISYGGWRVSEGQLAVGILVAYFGYVQALYQPMREMAEKWNLFLSGMTAAERIFSLFDWQREEDNERSTLHPRFKLQPPVRPNGIRGEIRFENVWFAYRGEEWVLQDFNLHILAGQKVGLVGHTGAGKSTIIGLLLRMYDPQKGRILLDGKDLREYSRRELRSVFGVIQQEAFLFSGSVSENISLWRNLEPEVRTQTERVLANLGKKHWFDEEGARALDERGSNLSMGERQVLAFARALAQKPSLWILDEATANIDSHTEEQIGQLISEAYRGKTAVMVAHRLATVASADQIIVLNRGVIVEQGRHAELLKKEGLYARLYRYQSAVEKAESKKAQPQAVAQTETP